MREASIERNTKETQIKLSLNLDGTGHSSLETGVGFFDHMLDGFTRHGLFDLNVQVHGDLEVDDHHTIHRRQKRHPPLRQLHSPYGRSSCSLCH